MKMLRSRVSPNCEVRRAEGQIQITTGAIQIGFLDFNRWSLQIPLDNGIQFQTIDQIPSCCFMQLSQIDVIL